MWRRAVRADTTSCAPPGSRSPRSRRMKRGACDMLAVSNTERERRLRTVFATSQLYYSDADRCPYEECDINRVRPHHDGVRRDLLRFRRGKDCGARDVIPRSPEGAAQGNGHNTSADEVVIITGRRAQVARHRQAARRWTPDRIPARRPRCRRRKRGSNQPARAATTKVKKSTGESAEDE